LSIYIYSKERQYLYYALGQLSVLFFLITLESLFISPFHAIYGIESFRLHALTHLMILLFSMLFIREFLHTNQIKKLDQIISIVIYLALLDIPIVLITSQNIITGFIPIFVPIWLVVSESFRLIKEKNRAYYLFYIGWNLVIITAVLVYSGLGSIIKSDFPFLHIAFSIESILLSLALTYKIKLLQEEKEAQQSLLLQQSRLASMGEMVASIAHQWRQPLTHLSYIFMNIKKNSNDPKVIENKLEEANTQLRYMSKTIDDFRNFYNPSKHKERYDIAHTCENAKAITYHALKNANINITITASQTFTFYGNKNEFEQVILNIINNARDALIAREIQNPSIKINIDKPTVTISDNAGGVEKRYQAKIFEPYFSTKERSDGIGLYIAKTIIEKEMGGILTLKNQNRGSQFIITFNLSQVQSPL
ncbi:MAG: sensor histidine kinase, partial [Epsilonproteobacteria bacterium]|nr:sensor histidine kinase [Campylobacterota bacterium]